MHKSTLPGGALLRSALVRNAPLGVLPSPKGYANRCQVLAAKYGHICCKLDAESQLPLVVLVSGGSGAGLAKRGSEVGPQRCSCGLDRAESGRL